MNIPGFTAEASLRRTNTIARRLPGPMPGAEGSVSVIPQRIKLQEWTCDCDAATDICICRSEHGAIRAIHAVLGEL